MKYKGGYYIAALWIYVLIGWKCVEKEKVVEEKGIFDDVATDTLVVNGLPITTVGTFYYDTIENHVTVAGLKTLRVELLKAIEKNKCRCNHEKIGWDYSPNLPHPIDAIKDTSLSEIIINLH